jgi:hypothetical protein
MEALASIGELDPGLAARRTEIGGEIAMLAADRSEGAVLWRAVQMSGLLLGTHRSRLLSAAAEYLNLSISNKEQTSDWSAPNLSQAQIDYAALDAVLVVKLAARMLPALGTIREGSVRSLGACPRTCGSCHTNHAARRHRAA